MLFLCFFIQKYGCKVKYLYLCSMKEKKIENIIFDYGRVLVDYSPEYLYDSVFTDKQEMQWFINHVVNAEFHTTLDLGNPTHEVIEEWKRRFPKYSHELDLYDTDYLRLVGEEMPGMRQLLTDLHEQKFQLYGLTNWGHKFWLVYEKFSIFQLLDGQVVSGEEHVVKPDPQIFKILLSRYNLIPEECIFTDDRAENVEAASLLGIHGIVFQNAEQLREEIGKLEVGIICGEV